MPRYQVYQQVLFRDYQTDFIVKQMRAKSRITVYFTSSLLSTEINFTHSLCTEFSSLGNVWPGKCHRWLAP